MTLFLLSLCLSSSIGTQLDCTRCPDGDVVVIVINESPGHVSGTPHRTQGQIPISGYVDTTIGVVFLSFSSSCGTVIATFSNLSTGDYYQATLNGNGCVMIPAILSDGSWQVTFSLSTGAEYIGKFEI